MTALIANRDTPKKTTTLVGAGPVKGSSLLYTGALLAFSAGYLAPGSTATGLICAGRCKRNVDNSGGTDGVDANGNPISAEYEPGISRWANGDSIGQADVGKTAYIVDDATVSKGNSGQSPAGVIVEVDANGVWVVSSPDLSRALIAAANLGSTGSGAGASLVAIADAGAFTAQTNVEAALQELYQHIETAHAVLPIRLAEAILAAGTPMAAFADNASSNPGITLDNSKAVGIRWNNAASQVAIWASVVLPLDLDPTAPATLVVLAAKSGATVGDATTFTVTAFAQTVSALEDAGADLGGTTTAMTGNATAKTVQRVTLSIATPPTPPAVLSLSIKPTNGTLGTDDATVVGVWLEYKRKPQTS